MTQVKVTVPKGTTQKHLHSRISYLYRAATYLADVAKEHQNVVPSSQDRKHQIKSRNKQEQLIMPQSAEGKAVNIGHARPHNSSQLQLPTIPRQLITQLRAVSRKSQIRLTPETKHTICKCCDLLLVPGYTATTYNENKSRGGKKPWAEVHIATCNGCRTVKRFPVGAKRQLKKSQRNVKGISRAVPHSDGCDKDTQD